MRCLVWLVLPALTVTFIGCGGETEGQRLDRLVPNALGTTKVTGSVLVDGQPVKDLWVTLHPKNPKIQERPRGQTDQNGKFALQTYTSGDGAPDGEWALTIAWLTYIKRDSDWGGEDKLKNQYNDPKTTPFKVTVAGTPLELPTFELKLKGVADSAAPAPSKKPVDKRDR